MWYPQFYLCQLPRFDLLRDSGITSRLTMGLTNKLCHRVVGRRKNCRPYPMAEPFSTIIRDAKKASGPKWHLNFDIVTAITKNLHTVDGTWCVICNKEGNRRCGIEPRLANRLWRVYMPSDALVRWSMCGNVVYSTNYWIGVIPPPILVCWVYLV